MATCYAFVSFPLDRPSMFRRHASLFAFVVGLTACAGATQSSGGSNGGSAASTGGTAAESSGAGAGGEDQTSVVVVADQCGHLTACVATCGAGALGDEAAGCTNGRYECPPGLRPAASCPEGSWTGSLASCGPWIKGYDCPQPPVCAERFWTCTNPNL